MGVGLTIFIIYSLILNAVNLFPTFVTGGSDAPDNPGSGRDYKLGNFSLHSHRYRRYYSSARGRPRNSERA